MRAVVLVQYINLVTIHKLSQGCNNLSAFSCELPRIWDSDALLSLLDRSRVWCYARTIQSAWFRQGVEKKWNCKVCGGSWGHHTRGIWLLALTDKPDQSKCAKTCLIDAMLTGVHVFQKQMQFWIQLSCFSVELFCFCHFAAMLCDTTSFTNRISVNIWIITSNCQRVGRKELRIVLSAKFQSLSYSRLNLGPFLFGVSYIDSLMESFSELFFKFVCGSSSFFLLDQVKFPHSLIHEEFVISNFKIFICS